MLQRRSLAPEIGPAKLGSSRVISSGEVGTVIYIALIALIAHATNLPYVLFPELGALSYDVLKRPHGTWAQAPFMLVITPFLAGIAGSLITRHLDYGFVSVLFSIGIAMLLIRVLRSPIAPAISAGFLPLSLGISSWLYAPSLLIGLIPIAALSLIRQRFFPSFPEPGSLSGYSVDDLIEEAPRDYSWIPFFVAFLLSAILLAEFTGWRLILFPPLVVIGFEMFGHARVCPWARRPLVFPVACTLIATVGVLLVLFFGSGPLAAAASVLSAIGVLRLFDLHMPPAIAIGLLPFVFPKPGYEYPLSVGIGTLLLTACFLFWCKIAVSGGARKFLLR